MTNFTAHWIHVTISPKDVVYKPSVYKYARRCYKWYENCSGVQSLRNCAVQPEVRHGRGRARQGTVFKKHSQLTLNRLLSQRRVLVFVCQGYIRRTQIGPLAGQFKSVRGKAFSRRTVGGKDVAFSCEVKESRRVCAVTHRPLTDKRLNFPACVEWHPKRSELWHSYRGAGDII